jgi:hypothetical protein
VLFADDINLLLTGRDGKELQLKVNEAIKKLENWFQENNLKINIEKTIAMSYHTVQNRSLVRPEIIYESKRVDYKSNTKFLGIYIEETLKWTIHLNTLRQQLCKVCYLIQLAQGIMGSGMIKSLYHSKFESLARYGIIFWGVERESIVIFRLQKRVIRTMCGVGRNTSCRQLFKDCKLLTITSLYILEVLCFIKKYKLVIQKNEQVHDHNTRRRKDLHVQSYNTNLHKKKCN